MNRLFITKRLPLLLVGVLFTATSYIGCAPVPLGRQETELKPTLVSKPNADRAGAQPVGIISTATVTELEQEVLEQEKWIKHNDAEFKRQRHKIERLRLQLSEY